MPVYKIDEYNKRFKAKTLNSENIKRLNKILDDSRKKGESPKILVEIPNTKGISSELIDTLDSEISIRIAGAYDEDRVKRFKDIEYTNGETGQYYIDSVIYTQNEVKNIISEMEKIEKKFMSNNLSDLEKTVYIYDRLKSKIGYDPKYEERFSSEIRSLRGLITNKTVCAGFAVIFKEMLDRQNIECHYVSGISSENGHAWNIISFDGKKYHPIDLTWEASQFRSRKIKNL